MYEKLNIKARNLMLLSEITLSAVLSCVVLAGYWFIRSVAEQDLSVIWLLLVLLVIWVFTLIAPFVRYERYRYRFTEEEIDVKEGFLFVERNVVPIERLQKVAMASGPYDRMFGLSKRIVTTAGGDVTIRFLEEEKAERIVEQLKQKINSYAVGSRNHPDTNPFVQE